MVMEATPSPDMVGREFVRQYYTLLNEAPEHAHRFYNSNSYFVHGSMTKPAIGQRQIHQKIQQLNFRDCHAKISQVDSQNTLGNGVVVQVSGELSNDGEPMRRFTQTFVLGTQSPKKYYVHNDIFRYQDMLLSEEEDGQQQQQPPPQIAADVLISPGKDATIIEPTPNDNPALVNADSTLEVAHDLYHHHLPQQQHTPAFPPASLNNPPANNILLPGSDVSSNDPHPQQQQQHATLNGAGIHHVDHVTNGGGPPAPSATSTNSSEVDEFSGGEGVVVGVGAFQVGGSGQEEVKEFLPTVTADVNVEKHIVEPTTYASFLKSSSSTTAPTPSQPSEPTSPPQSAPPISTGHRHPPQPLTPISLSNTPPTPNPTPNHYTPSSGFRQSLPPRNAPTPRGGPRGVPASISIPSNVGYGAAEVGSSGSAEGQERGQRGGIGSAVGGGGMGVRPVNYPDHQQLFLGKIPHTVTEEELKEVFGQFGRIIDLRIHSNTNINTGMGANGGGKPGSNSRPTSNFGFVIFEDPQSVSEVLNNRPITLGEVQLNVQVKRQKLPRGDIGGGPTWNRGGGSGGVGGGRGAGGPRGVGGPPPSRGGMNPSGRPSYGRGGGMSGGGGGPSPNSNVNVPTGGGVPGGTGGGGGGGGGGPPPSGNQTNHPHHHHNISSQQPQPQRNSYVRR